MSSGSTEERRSGLHPALSMRQGFALIEEAGSVRNLLRDSVEAIRNLRFVSLRGDAVFTLGSIGGGENDEKVMLGCRDVGALGSWPSMKKLKYEWGHDIEALNTLLGSAIEDGLAGSTHVEYAETLASRISGNTVLPLLLLRNIRSVWEVGALPLLGCPRYG